MGKEIFVRDQHGYYEGTNEEIPADIFHLEMFLNSEIGSSEDRWKKRLMSEEDSELFCNITYLRKEGDTVFLGWFVSPDHDEYPDPNEYKTSVSEFLNMISTWFRLKKEKPKKIILEVEGEKISLYGEN